MFIAGIGFLIALTLVFLRVPIALAMGTAGFLGFGYLIGWPQSMTMIANTAQDSTMSYTLAVVPLFILMGNIVAGTGVSSELYRSAQAFLGGRKGGLASATIVASAGFASICGSSVATVVTMGRVAIPSMREFKYDDQIGSATVAAGATLGILIPPSVILVLYGIITGTHIGKLYAAGLIPGILGVILYLLAVRWIVMRNPEMAPVSESQSWSARFRSLTGVWSAVLLFVVVIGGIYSGFFTATEAAGFGAAGAVFIAVARRRMTLTQFYKILVDTARTTATLFVLIIGAFVFTEFLNLSGAHNDLLRAVENTNLSPQAIIFALCIFYILLGMLLDTGSMILLTVPLFFPVVTGLGYDPVWFGILVVVLAELGLITPPIGLNLFVIKSVLYDVSLSRIIKGIVPFIAVDIVRVALIAAFPVLSLYLPNLLFG